MDTFRLPIKYRNGGVEKIQDLTDEYYGHLLSMSIQIMPTELPLNPQYGVEDATFDESLTRDLAFTAGAFIPEIVIDSAQIVISENGQSTIDISFSQVE